VPARGRRAGGRAAGEAGGQARPVIRIERPPAEHPLRLAVGDPPVLGIESAGRRREAGLVERLERRRRLAEQPAGLLDHRILAARMVVGDVVGAGRRVEAGDHGAHDVVDMDAAEHLLRQVDAMDAALGHPLQRRSTRAVDSGQAEDAGAPGQPLRVRRRAGGTAAAERRALVHPGALRVAIDAGGGEIAEPMPVIEQRAVARQHRILLARRHR